MTFSELSKTFKSYNLTVNNILDFMILEDNDNNKYILKLYLLSLMETHKHSQKLSSYVYLLTDDAPITEIIKKKKKKPFWESVKKHPTYSFSYFSFFAANSNGVYYFFKEKRKYENAKQTLKENYIKANSFFSRIKIKKQLNQLEKNYKLRCKKFKEQFNIKYSKELQKFIDLFSNYAEKAFSTPYDSTECENVEAMTLINIYLDFMRDSSEMVAILKRDLIFSYNMICTFFSEKFIKENDLSTLLNMIRTSLSEFRIDDTVPDYREEILKTEYRNYNLKYKSEFFKNTTDYAEIESEMANLFSEYNRIKDTENTNEYIYGCYQITQKLLQIHPYGNGNGRTSKYLFYILLLKRGILPFTITDSNYITNCYQKKGLTEDYIYARQTIMNDRINNYYYYYEPEEQKNIIR